MRTFTMSGGGTFAWGTSAADTGFTGTDLADIFVAYGIQGATFTPGHGADTIYGFSADDHLVLSGGPRTTAFEDTAEGLVIHHGSLGYDAESADKVLLYGVHKVAADQILFG